MGFGNQIKYLLYRNFLIKRRNIKQTTYEAVSVLYFIAILAVVRKTAVRPKTYPPIKDANLQKYPLYPPATLGPNVTFLPMKPPKEVGYVYLPGSSTEQEVNLIKKLRNVTAVFGTKFTSFPTEKALQDAHKAAPNNLTIGLVLNINVSQSTVDYTIKVPYKSVPLTSAKKRNAGNDKCRGKGGAMFRIDSCPVNTYLSSSFATFQALVDNAIIEALTNQTGYLPPKITVQMFPKGEYKTSLSYLKTIISIYMVIAFSPYIMFLLTHIVTEKEKKIKEAMKIMGLSQFAFWFTWFITYAVVITIGVILVVIIARVSELFGNSDYFIIFIIFFLYGLSIESLAFVLTPLFQKGKTAGMAGSLATMLLGTLSLIHIYVKTSNAVKWVTGLLSPVALSLALTPAVDTDTGVNWGNVGSKGDFPSSYGIILLLIDAILYLFLAIYLDALFPGEYGQRKHPLFCFKASFWNSFREKSRRKPSLFRGLSVTVEESKLDIEQVPEEWIDNLAIRIRKLKKVFWRGKEQLNALDGVSLDVYEGQITALLGHNGAGKSTLIAALTGMLPPSGGNAIVYGNSIRNPDDLEKIRQMIGLCPQQNIIFEELTPREHLRIFAGIKGLPSNVINNEVEKTLKEIDLYDKADSISKNLSGGQKRKLCVGIALIGDPKVVFLDEPTSGMDPSSRRYIWSLLQGKKEGRVILLTTHFMDEADILADYKAVLNKGKVRCAGSSLFLKSRFGVGYHLGMVVDQDCDRSQITNLVTNIVPGSDLSRSHSKELSFRLPMKSVDQFPDLFSALEKENNSSEPCCAPQLGIESYGVSMTTLEEVFLKLDDNNEEQKNGDEDHIMNKSEDNLVLDDSEKGSPHLSSRSVHINLNEIDRSPDRGSFALMWLQLTALLEVRFWLTVRSFMKIFFQIIVPPGLLIAGFVVMKGSNKTDVAGVVRRLPLPPSMYLIQGSISSKDHTELILQNNTKKYINDIIVSLKDGQLKNSIVRSLSAAKRPHDVGLQIDSFNSSSGQADYLLRYNDSSIYTVPVGITTMSNTALRVALKKAGKTYQGRLNPILASSQPFESLKIPWVYDGSVFTAVLLIGLTFALLPNGFSIEVVQIRQFGIRHQLRVSGVNRLVYWLQHLIGDLILYLFPFLLIYILIPAFDLKSLNNPTALGTLFLLLMLYCPVSLLFSYVISFAFKQWETIQNVMGTVLVFLAMGPYVAVSITDMVSGEINGPDAAHIVHIVCLILDPPYAIFGGLYYLTRVWRTAAAIAQDNNVKVPASKYYEMSLQNGLPTTLIVLTLQIFILSYFVLILDMWKTGGVMKFPLSLCKTRKGLNKINSSPQDDDSVNQDVKSEIEKVQNLLREGRQADRSIIVEGLKKDFGTKRVVDNVYLDVDKGEILGLLGPNGAGKTTTMNLITADFPATSGEIYVGGHNIDTELNEAFQSLGYCPQFDTIWETITLEQHLKCFSLIKGVPRDKVDNLVRHYMSALNVQEHSQTRAGQLSGGTKRKLCFLMSMCGNPNIVLMDEPSTGMDPSSKRFLWNVISKNVTGECGAILTTHSMEEADALCSRVGIIVKGQLKCIGTTQELKSNYGGGYSLELKACLANDMSLEDRMVQIDSFVHQMFADAIEVERFGARIIYKVPKDNVGKLSKVFTKFEEGKEKLGIEEYSFSQSSLEQVFLEFAREQDDDLRDEDEENKKKEIAAA